MPRSMFCWHSEHQLGFSREFALVAEGRNCTENPEKNNPKSRWTLQQAESDFIDLDVVCMMMKTKLPKPRKSLSSSTEDVTRTFENGLYTHSSPPKVAGGSGGSKVREFIRAGDVGALEEILLAGNGQSLINQPSTDKSVRAFLKTVPAYMSKIDLVHDAAERGSLRDLKALMDRRKLSKSRDSKGVGLLHKAVLHGHKDIVDYLVSEYPESTEVTDNEGRTPLHYCGASKDRQDIYKLLSERVADAQLRDDKGKTASYYMQRPSDLGITRPEIPKNSVTPTRKKWSPNSKKNSPSHKLKTPPKREGLNITGANIRIWIHDQDLPKLEQIVWEGQGHRLLNETSNQTKVRQFLSLVPKMMTKIKEVHQASISGDIETIEAKAEPAEILLAKDQNGLVPLHRAAALGHMDICEWIVQKNQNSLHSTDRKGRTPLHYATNPTDGGEIYNYFVANGADPQHLDHFKKSPEYYRGRPGDIDVNIVYDPPSAPRIGGSLIDLSSSRFPSRSNSGGRQRPGGRWVASPLSSERSLETLTKSSVASEPPPVKKVVNHNNNNNNIINSKISKTKNNFYNNLYNRGRKDNVGKRKFVDMSKVTEREINKMIQEGEVENLEYVVLSGRAYDLQGKSSWNDNVRKFLKKVPTYTEKIKQLQQAAADGNVQLVKKLTRENPKYSMGRDKDSAIALHWGAKSGNTEVVNHLIDTYPEGIYVEDKDRRVPVHWAAISRQTGAHQTYDLLEQRGSYVHACDVNGRSANDYFSETSTLGPESDLRSVSRNSESNLSRLTPQMDSQPSSRNNSLTRRSRSRSRSITNSTRNLSVSPARSQSKSPTRSHSKSPVRSQSKSPAKSPSKSLTNNRKPRKREKSKPQQKEPDEYQQAVIAAENEDYKGISHIILRGDGDLLIGRKSNNEEVQRFLEDLPESLESIKQIQLAVEEGDLRKTQHMVDRKEKAYVRDANGSNLLHTAALYGHSDIVRYLIQEFPDLINQKDKKGRTPLHYAAVLRDGGHVSKILKSSKGDPQAKDDSGSSPEDYENNPELLTQKQLKDELIQGKNERGKQSIANQNNSPVSEGEEEEEDANDEEEESRQNETEAKEKKEKNGRNVDDNKEVEKDGNAEIQKAIERAEHGDYEGLGEIVRKGEGHLIVGRKSSNEEVQGYLDKIPEILNNIKEAYVAVAKGNTRKTAHLMDRKQKAMVKTHQGATFLHVAVINGHSETVRYLVQTYPALLQEVDNNGRTPLHYAAVVRDGGHIYKILKKEKANSKVVDKLGYTPEDYLHDPQLLTQWDLLKELQGEDHKSKRPITKDSVATYYGSEEEGMERTDTKTLGKLEAAYKTLKSSDSNSLLQKYLTDDVFDKLKHRVTESGATLSDVINSGVENLDSSIGIYAPDAESYTLFKELFDPVIEEYHGVTLTEDHPAVDFGDTELFGDFNEQGDYVVSTRIRCARSLEGYPFNPKMTAEHYAELEQDVEAALDMLDGDLAGYYNSLENLSEEKLQTLTDEHLLFKIGDRFLKSAGACRFWPKGRGIFLNSDDTFCVWINEEDHMRIISMQNGGDIKQVYDRFIRALSILQERLPFSHTPRLGYLTFCPTNLGTAIRASVHIRLPKLGQNKELLEQIAEEFHLQVRGTSGEHTETVDNIFDISNKRRLGLTEVEAIQDMYKGVSEIIRKETELSSEESGNDET